MEFVVPDWLKVKIFGLSNLKLGQAVEKLACASQ